MNTIDIQEAVDLFISSLPSSSKINCFHSDGSSVFDVKRMNGKDEKSCVIYLTTTYQYGIELSSNDTRNEILSKLKDGMVKFDSKILEADKILAPNNGEG